MDITHTRLFDTGNETICRVSLNGKHWYFSLEPEKGKRIEAGCYEIKKRVTENYLSDMTKDYRKIYDWFDWHLELQGVPDSKYVYIHHGNFRKDTKKCLLTGNEAGATYINNSRKTFEKVYKKISEILDLHEERVFINIIDE